MYHAPATKQLGCGQSESEHLRRRWYVKSKKSFVEKFGTDYWVECEEVVWREKSGNWKKQKDKIILRQVEKGDLKPAAGGGVQLTRHIQSSCWGMSYSPQSGHSDPALRRQVGGRLISAGKGG